MGLTIRVYKNIRKERKATEEDKEGIIPDKVALLYKNPHFPLSAWDIESECVWSYSDSYKFNAGSYHGYGAWREQLATLVGFPEAWEERRKRTDLPFYGLIVFADNEGTIGPAACAKLAKDFEEWSERASGTVRYAWCVGTYDRFAQAFRDAARNGAVEFC